MSQRMSPGYSAKDSKIIMPKLHDELYPDVVANLPSLSGKVVAITGTTSGTGYWCAIATASKGAAAILLLNRPSERAAKADADIQLAVDKAGVSTKVTSIECDLSSFASVRQAAQAAKQYATGGLDVLCCNAGVGGQRDVRTSDGFDLQMQTNHLSHALLIELLESSLEQAATARGEARVVFHSSGARFFLLGPKTAVKDFGGDQFTACAPGTLYGDSSGAQQARYNHSKLANSAYTMALHERFKAAGSKVKALCADPGAASTSFFHNTTLGQEAGGCAAWVANWMLWGMASKMTQSGPDGTCPLLLACFSAEAHSGDLYSPEHSKMGMKFYCKGAPKKMVAGNKAVDGVTFSETNTLSPENQRKAWEATRTALGITHD